MFVLMLLIVMKGVLIGGHAAKSEMSHGHGLQSGQVIVESILAEDGTSELHRSLAFYPSSLDFGAWAVGTARSHIVTLVNKNANRSVYLSSISGKTPIFYSSFFEDKVVPPQGNTTFNVVFLPRSYGKVETNLFIHTSFGQAKLPIKGEGRECPYRLRSLVGLKAPLNSTIKPEIYMYNPHANPIQILEVYSSGGQFQLELPSGGQEGPQALWEIPPYTSKPVIRIRFHGIQPGNHSAYIRIKISGGANRIGDEDVLVIPVDVEILTSWGIYSPNPIIDFGKIASNEDIKVMKIDLVNSGSDRISVIDYKLRNVNNLIKLQETELALILNPKLAEKNTFINGELIIKSQHKQTPNQFMELSVNIQAEVYKGSLEFQKNLTVFITGAKNYSRDERDFFIKNSYSVPVAITNITINKNDSSVFKLRDFIPQVIHPGEKIILFKISAVNESANFITPLKIETNLTSYELSLVVCTGLLKRYTSIDPTNLTKLPEESVLDFGIVPFGEFSNFGFILMTNPNPIPIQLIKWNFTNPRGVYYQSMFMGCAEKSDLISGNKQSLPEKFNLCLNLSSSKIAAFELAVQSFNIKSFTGTFKVWTEIEEVVTTVKFVTVMGRLEIDQSRLHFNDCFPGKRCSADISIQSTFLKTMRVASITVSVPGLVFEYHTQNGLPEITANSITDIGRIHFDPKSVCGAKCYIPQENDIDVAKGNNLDFDEAELRKRTELFRHFKWSLQKITFTLNTSEIRLFEFNSTVDIIWPKLVKGIQVFSPIEVGQTYDGILVLNNPSSRPLHIHLSLSDPKRAKTTSLSLPLEVVEICVYCYLTDEDVFHLIDNEFHIIPPNSFHSIKIRFTAKESGVHSTLLHIRNNLTLYEAVWITGKAVQPQFRFGNRKPGSQTPLLFEVHEKQLSICEGGSEESVMVSTKRTFTARNTGEVPILIEAFLIGDRLCEGYGFKILDCSTFELKSNTSKKIDIIFTPDFTMTRVSRPLVLKTNLSYTVNYTLLATVPHPYLEQCAYALQRPFWETHMKRMSVGMLAIAFIFVLIAAFLDSVKVLTDHVQSMSREKGPLQPPLDLRNIGVKTSLPENTTYNNGISNHEKQSRANNNSINNVKKRNSRRNCIQTQMLSSRDKPWAEELAKKLNTASKSPEIQTSNLFSNRISPNSNSGNNSFKSNISVTTGNKAKEDKQTLTKKSGRDNGEIQGNYTEKNLTVSGGIGAADRKSEIKMEAPQTMEMKKPKLSFKKTKSIVMPLNAVQIDHVKEVNNEPVNNIAEKQERVQKPSKGGQKEKVDFTEKRNIIPLSSASSLYTSNSQGGSPVQSENSIPVKINSNSRKYGKTPGRERKKEQNTTSKRTDRKSTKFKGTAFQFNSPLKSNTQILSSSSVWDQNQISFSHVVAQNIPNGSQNGKMNFVNKNYIEQQMINESEHEWNEADLKNHETFGPDIELKSTPLDLGPIGTRKSPSSTPVWEPLPQNIHRPKPNLSAQPNSSYFSSNFPIANNNNFEYTADNQYLGGTSGLLEHFILENQNSNRWEANNVTNNVLLSLLCQQNAVRQQPEWQHENRLWTPMGYQDEPNGSSLLSDQMNVWQRGPTVRPPPGLGLPKDNSISNQQQTVLSSFTSQNTECNDRVDPIVPFDPFSSLSAIWSDSWNKKNNKSNQQ